jgi:hypothetical protein
MRPAYRPGTRTGLLLAAVTQTWVGWGDGCSQSTRPASAHPGRFDWECPVSVTPRASSPAGEGPAQAHELSTRCRAAAWQIGVAR